MTPQHSSSDGRAVLDLLRCSVAERTAHDAGYVSGYADGLRRGREQAEADMREAWAPVVHHVRALGSPATRSAADLADARGQHFRAATIRADHQRRGVTT